jgi:YidC/Oxa1 family membrane protein insertase
MDRRTLLAVALILAVLIGDQIFMAHLAKKRRAAQGPVGTTEVTGGDSAATGSAGGTGGGTGAGTGTGGVGGVTPSGGAAGTTGGGLSTGAPAGGGAPGAAASMGIVPGLGPRVAPAPVVQHEIGNDEFKATFTSLGGSISSWVLPAYKNPLEHKAPVDLVAPGRRAVQVVVTTPVLAYDFSNVPFRMEIGTTDGAVTFVAEDSSGIVVRKTYRKAVTPEAMDVEIRISVPPELGPIQYRWGWASPLPQTEVNAMARQFQAVALLGAKLDACDAGKFAKLADRAPQGNVRFAGDRSKYFIAAMIPDSATVDAVTFEAAPPAVAGSMAASGSGAKQKDPTAGVPTVWLAGAAPPGTEIVRHARLYAGPIHYDTLVAQGAGLDQVANLGWAWIVPLSALLLRLLNLLYKAIPNYGLAIIILSAATKLIFAPLTQSSLRSAKAMHRLQPLVNDIRERYKNDPAKMNTAMMALYKENKVNPLGGCLPMLLQLPVFVALYNILLNSIELRAAGFWGYIQDLSGPDVLMKIGGFPIHLLPIVMTGSTFIMQSQTPIDPRQRSMMMVMPLMMLVFMYNFPSGVVLYWTVNNLLSALQQYMVNVAEDRKMAAGG